MAKNYNKLKYLFNAKQNNFVDTKLKDDEQINGLKSEMKKLENKVIHQPDLYSDSDASDHRKDEIEVEIDNAVNVRLHDAFKTGS